MSDSESWESVQVGEPTHSRWGPWHVTITWRQVVTANRSGHVYAAGVELRGWTDPVGLSPDRLGDAVLTTRGRPPALGSDLLVKKIRWGQVLAEHRALLEAQLRERVERVRSTQPRRDGSAAQWAESMDAFADRAGRERAPRGGRSRTSTAATLALVAELYPQAEREDPLRVARRVLELLQLKGYPLDVGNASDRSKVRRWIVQAGCTTTEREGSE